MARFDRPAHTDAAEGEGFEPPWVSPRTAFEAGAFDRLCQPSWLRLLWLGQQPYLTGGITGSMGNVNPVWSGPDQDRTGGLLIFSQARCLLRYRSWRPEAWAASRPESDGLPMPVRASLHVLAMLHADSGKCCVW